jgi:hypothetical protein
MNLEGLFTRQDVSLRPRHPAITAPAHVEIIRLRLAFSHERDQFSMLSFDGELGVR